MEDDLVDPIQNLWSEASNQVEVLLLLLHQAWESLLPVLERPEVGQSDLVPRKLHRFEAGGRANDVVDVDLEKTSENREDVVDANLVDEAGFHNVTAPGLVLPIRPVNKSKFKNGPLLG